jgi:hypothetical protein
MEFKMNESVVLCIWEFDNCGSTYKSCINFLNTDYGHSLSLYEGVEENENPNLTVHADFDQWGVWITFKIGESSFTIAQEAETRSFLDALIASLTKLKEMTDMACKPSTLIVKENENENV